MEIRIVRIDFVFSHPKQEGFDGEFLGVSGKMTESDFRRFSRNEKTFDSQWPMTVVWTMATWMGGMIREGFPFSLQPLH
jgi:hypothetical protein